MPGNAKRKPGGHRRRSPQTRRVDGTVLDNLGCTPLVTERELEVIERFLGDDLRNVLEGSGSDDEVGGLRPLPVAPSH
jgi:hypothetical protein